MILWLKDVIISPHLNPMEILMCSFMQTAMNRFRQIGPRRYYQEALFVNRHCPPEAAIRALFEGSQLSKALDLLTHLQPNLTRAHLDGDWWLSLGENDTLMVLYAPSRGVSFETIIKLEKRRRLSAAGVHRFGIQWPND